MLYWGLMIVEEWAYCWWTDWRVDRGNGASEDN